MDLRELIKKEMSGHNEKRKSENAMTKILRNSISIEEAKKLHYFIREQSRETLDIYHADI